MNAKLDAEAFITLSESASALIERGAAALIEQGRQEVLSRHRAEVRREGELAALIAAGKSSEIHDLGPVSFHWLLLEAARRSIGYRHNLPNDTQAGQVSDRESGAFACAISGLSGEDLDAIKELFLSLMRKQAKS